MNVELWRRLVEARGATLPLGALGPDAVAIGRDLDELEALGYAIDRPPYLGAAYRGPSPRLVVDQIERDPTPIHIGRRVAVWRRVGSTNDLAARAAASRANDGLVVLAEEQTQGRGSRGRRWVAPAGTSILLSALVFPPEPLVDAAWLTALGAVATAEVVEEITGAEARIKWPNDVRVGGSKVAGVLVERGAGAVIGVGLNVSAAPPASGLPVGSPAASLAMLGGPGLDRSEIARGLIGRLDGHYVRGLAEGPSPLIEAWRGRLELMGREVRVETSAGWVEGRLVDVDPAMGLRIEGAGRSRTTVAGPSVRSLSPAGPS